MEHHIANLEYAQFACVLSTGDGMYGHPRKGALDLCTTEQFQRKRHIRFNLRCPLNIVSLRPPENFRNGGSGEYLENMFNRVLESAGFLTVCITSDRGNGSEIIDFAISTSNYYGTAQGKTRMMHNGSVDNNSTLCSNSILLFMKVRLIMQQTLSVCQCWESMCEHYNC